MNSAANSSLFLNKEKQIFMTLVFDTVVLYDKAIPGKKLPNLCIEVGFRLIVLVLHMYLFQNLKPRDLARGEGRPKSLSSQQSASTSQPSLPYTQSADATCLRCNSGGVGWVAGGGGGIVVLL